MKCPVDGTALLITERSGVEIDYCPQCRGVWLDRGELDKIIERTAQGSPARQPHRPAPSGDWHEDPRGQRYDPRDRRDHRDERYHKKRRKKSFLGEIFDFD